MLHMCDNYQDRENQTDFLDEGCGVRVEPKDPRERCSGRLGFVRLFVPVPTHLYECRESLGCWMIGAEDVGVGLFGARVTVVACVSVQVTPEVNEIRLLASAISPSDTVPHKGSSTVETSPSQ
jgi:hypothetical protein